MACAENTLVDLLICRLVLITPVDQLTNAPLGHREGRIRSLQIIHLATIGLLPVLLLKLCCDIVDSLGSNLSRWSI